MGRRGSTGEHHRARLHRVERAGHLRQQGHRLHPQPGRSHNSLAALWNRGGGIRGGGVPAVTGRQLHHRDLHPCRRWSTQRQAGMVGTATRATQQPVRRVSPLRVARHPRRQPVELAIWKGLVMTAKVLYDKRGEVAYITLNRPEVKNAIDIEAHELLCEMWRDFRDDPALRVAVITGTGDAFTAGADLKTHAPEWQTVGPMVGRERLEDGLCGITRGPLSRITKPIVAAINGWCVGHGVELAMACDIRIASERAQFGTFEVRRGMHPADGGMVRLVNTCGVGVALELLLTGEPISAERALTANMVARVVPHDKLMEETDAVVQRILRCDQAAIESAKETVLEIIGRPLHDQLRVEAMWGYALCGGNTTVMERSQQFFDKVDPGRAGATATPL